MALNRRRLGNRGEDLAAAALQQAGYQLLCRNYRKREGEIDIIAEKDGVCYFVEVKARRGQAYGAPVESVTAVKRRQIARVAAIYFAEQGAEQLSGFLIAAVDLADGAVELIEDSLL